VHRVGVSAPDIAGADESNPPASESFRSIVACFEMASGLIRPLPGKGTGPFPSREMVSGPFRILGVALFSFGAGATLASVAGCSRHGTQRHPISGRPNSQSYWVEVDRAARRGKDKDGCRGFLKGRRNFQGGKRNQ
jgi:hypothetical protein